MRRFVVFQLLVLNFSLLIGCKALPPGLILTSRHYTETSLGHHTLVKRVNGQDLWDNLQIRLACGAEDDVKETQDDISKSEKFNLYAPFTKPFQKTTDTQEVVGYDIRDTIRILSDSGDTDTLFTFRETTSAKDPSANNICFQHNFLVSKGIVIAENNERPKDMVPKADQLSWSDIVFYTYKQLNNGDVSNMKYLFQHHITNKGTISAITDAYTSLKIDRNTDVSWTYGDQAKRAGFLAILETRNAQGAAYMLTDHAVAMGRKNIKRIVTLAYDVSKKSLKPALYVEIGNEAS